MRLTTALTALLALVSLASCGGATISDACRQRMNDCMRTCPATTIDRPYDRGFMQPADTRSECELRCRQGCVP